MAEPEVNVCLDTSKDSVQSVLDNSLEAAENKDDDDTDPSFSALTEEQQLEQQELVAAVLQTLHQFPSTEDDGTADTEVSLDTLPSFLLPDSLTESLTSAGKEGDEGAENEGLISTLLKCPCCSYTATDQDDLDVHALGEHPENCVFSCKVCDFSTDRWSRYSRHVSKHFLAEKSFTCPLCSYRSKTKGCFDAHMRTHTGEKPYACSYCPYRSSQRVHLKIHVRTHTGEKPFACPSCPYQATQNSSLKRHIQTQHPVVPRVSRRYNRYMSAAARSSSMASLPLSGPTDILNDLTGYPSPMAQQLCLLKQQQECQTTQDNIRLLFQQQLQQYISNAVAATAAQAAASMPGAANPTVLPDLTTALVAPFFAQSEHSDKSKLDATTNGSKTPSSGTESSSHKKEGSKSLKGKCSSTAETTKPLRKNSKLKINVTNGQE